MAMSNPALSTDAFVGTWAETRTPSNVMTIPGTAIKAFGLLAILMISAGWSWMQVGQGTMNNTLLIGSAIGGTIVAWLTVFNKSWSPFTAPVYAALEGVFLGAISNFLEQRYHTGLAYEAVALTLGTTFLMLFVYATRLIRVTGRLAAGITAATGGICMLYLAQIVLSMFHISIPGIFGNGLIGVGFSVFVVGLAAFNLLLDFDVIEQGSAYGAPKYMEWYAAFGLMVTLVWLYLEILRLLAKLQRRNN